MGHHAAHGRASFTGIPEFTGGHCTKHSNRLFCFLLANPTADGEAVGGFFRSSLTHKLCYWAGKDKSRRRLRLTGLF